MQNTQMTVGGVAGEVGQGPAPTAKKDAGLTPQRTRGVPTNRGKARRYASNSRDLRVGSGGFLKFEFSGVAEGVGREGGDRWRRLWYSGS